MKGTSNARLMTG